MVNWIFPSRHKNCTTGFAACLPGPSAYSYLDGKRIKVHKSALLPDLSGESGVIQEGKRLIVGCGEGSLELLEVQPEGGKRMSGQDFLRGRRPGTEKKFTSCPSE